MYELNLEAYKGPMEKLLELIEDKKMEVTTVSLAAVTADFLNYINKLEFSFTSQILADFLAVASKLILIKSKALLPSLELTEEEAMDVNDLEKRLKIYQQFKEAQKYIKTMWSETPKMMNREFLSGAESLFYPPEKLTLDEMMRSLFRVINELEKITTPKESIKTEIINLKHKIEEVLNRLTHEPIDFKSLHVNKSKKEIIALFLAILQLVKDQLIQAEQENNFYSIRIAKNKV